MRPEYAVDYVTEREATAIRCNAFGLGDWRENCALMTIEFRDQDGIVAVPRSTVMRFMDDWRRCGAWSLHGRKGEFKPMEEAMTEHTSSPLAQKVASILHSKTISAADADEMIREIRLHVAERPPMPADFDDDDIPEWTEEQWDKAEHRIGDRIIRPSKDPAVTVAGDSGRELWKPDLVIYHGGGCADGFGAAWACWRRWGDAVTFHAANYGAPPPDVAGKHVLIVDFSYKRPVLEEMGAIAASIIILDHHETAQEDLAEFVYPVPDVLTLQNARAALADLDDFAFPRVFADFDMKRSGARMAWEFCFPDAEVPLLLRLIEDRDLWLFRYDATRPFATWLRAEPFSFERWSEIDLALDAPYGNDIMREAEAMQRFHDEKVREIASFARYEQLGEHRPLVVNCPPMFASEVGNLLLEQHPDAPFSMTYFDSGTKRLLSLRSTADRIAVSTIAARYGGGGHRNAAGFSVALAFVAPGEEGS